MKAVREEVGSPHWLRQFSGYGTVFVDIYGMAYARMVDE